MSEDGASKPNHRCTCTEDRDEPDSGHARLCPLYREPVADTSPPKRDPRVDQHGAIHERVESDIAVVRMDDPNSSPTDQYLFDVVEQIKTAGNFAAVVIVTVEKDGVTRVENMGVTASSGICHHNLRRVVASALDVIDETYPDAAGNICDPQTKH